MEKTTTEIDVRDLILKELKKIERPLTWLAEKVEVKYSAMYAMFVQRTYEPKQSLIDKINKVLNTNYTANAA